MAQFVQAKFKMGITRPVENAEKPCFLILFISHALYPQSSPQSAGCAWSGMEEKSGPGLSSYTTFPTARDFDHVLGRSTHRAYVSEEISWAVCNHRPYDSSPMSRSGISIRTPTSPGPDYTPDPYTPGVHEAAGIAGI